MNCGKILLGALTAGAMVCGTPIAQDVLMQPQAVCFSDMGATPGFLIEDLINQNGLSEGYVSGVTPAWPYLTNAQHFDPGTWVSQASLWTGRMVFDLGATYKVKGIAYWNGSNFHSQAIRFATLKASTECTWHGGSTLLGQFSEICNTYPNAVVLEWPAVNARRIEWTITNCNSGFGTIAAEVAFIVAGNAWVDLGCATPGTNGVAVLSATGSLAEGSSGTVTLTNAPANTSVLLMVTLASTLNGPMGAIGSTQAFGGVVKPALPGTAFFVLTTDANGELNLPFSNFPLVASGSGIVMQALIQDFGVPGGVILSNALAAEVP